MRASILPAVALMLLGGCATQPNQSILARVPYAPPVFQSVTASQRALFDIPSPSRPIAVAVYGFTDQTGQFRASDTGQTLSRAVTQGGTSILVKSLQDAGRRSWFTIIEREQIGHLLNERQIIREMRERYLGESTVNPEALPSLLFAGVILEGGVIGYDTNTVTGGSGAGFLGISAHTEYRQDTVTVYLRAVSVRTGEVLTSVTTSKTIASYALGGGAFRYVGFKQLLEAEAGMSTNEPDQLALQQAIEKAVYALIMEGVDLKLWDFNDPAAGWPSLWRYQQERDGVFTAEQVEAASRARPPEVAVRRQDVDRSATRDALAAVVSNSVSASNVASSTPPAPTTRTGS
ncbi:hypothetical protein MMB232_02795 [Brevundimonas subvibrioides]|uniref:CsgG/HfaB family protein n=1 Tax=Brevundimonas subvibrioides TaxID=74313 RepID=UPI0032D56E59